MAGGFVVIGSCYGGKNSFSLRKRNVAYNWNRFSLAYLKRVLVNTVNTGDTSATQWLHSLTSVFYCFIRFYLFCRRRDHVRLEQRHFRLCYDVQLFAVSVLLERKPYQSRPTAMCWDYWNVCTILNMKKKCTGECLLLRRCNRVSHLRLMSFII